MVQLSKDSVCTSRLAVAIRAIHASIIAAEAAGKALPFKSYATRKTAERQSQPYAKMAACDVGMDEDMTVTIVFYANAAGGKGRYVPMFDYGTPLEAGAGGYVCRAAAAGFVQY